MKNKIIIYQNKSGAIEFKGDFKKETLWASQAQIVELFDVDQSVVSQHIRNAFKDGEIDQKKQYAKNAYCKFRQAGSVLFTRCRAGCRV